MSHEKMSRDDFDALASLRLAEFTEAELIWSAEVAKQNFANANKNGASEPCTQFWTFLHLFFLDELDSRKRPT